MHRFIAMAWDSRSTDATRQADAWRGRLEEGSKAWRACIDVSGLRVFAPVATKTVLATGGDDSLVIGALFARGRETAGCISTLAPGALVRHGSAGLIQDFWGDYIAIWRDAASGAVTVFRDPCGAIGCFSARFCAIQLFCSTPADIADLPGVRFSIDWTSLEVFLACPPLATRRTCLIELSEVLPGEEAVWKPGAELQWRPSRHASRLAEKPHRLSFEAAASELRRITQDCLMAWSQSFRHIAVRLSGGLDSSIVACLLARAPGARITALHLIGRGYEAHERDLARLTARRAGIELLEFDPGGPPSRFEDMSRGPLLARPTLQWFGARMAQYVTAACLELGADSVMSGHGGDTLFLQRGLASGVLADDVLMHGLRGQTARTAYDVAMLQECSIWDVLGETASRLTRRIARRDKTGLDRATSANGVLRDEHRARLAGQAIRCSCLRGLERLPPCKKEQVEAMLALKDYYPVLQRRTPLATVFPLISQPISDLVLRTPARIFCEGGLDRALERRAFADLIPPEVAQRTEKGFINHHLTADIARNIDGLRERLLDGDLVRHEAIDRGKLERLLTLESLQHPQILNTILKLIAADVWLAAWRFQGD
ncbi:MAG: hypothetical protein GC185_09085 [Alphaproteobacteria bacterium]|nr:hypothetical protein [Alphaproteobacteria bacterium]